MCKVSVTVTGDLPDAAQPSEEEIQELMDEFRQEFDWFFFSRGRNIQVEVNVT